MVMNERVQPTVIGTCLARTPETQAQYEAYIAEQRLLYGTHAPCPFETLNSDDESIMSEEATALALRNKFPYNVYDGQKVVEHLLVIPKRHVRALGELSLREKDDYWALLTKYEELGYSSMTRSPANHARSVRGHVHTHQFLYGPLLIAQHFDREQHINATRFAGEKATS